MCKKAVPAIYENGVFTPQTPVEIRSGTEVDLITPEPGDDSVEILKVRFPDSFGIMGDEDAAELLEIIHEEFGFKNL